MIFQLSIIFLISFIGEILNHIIPFPIPGSIYGMVLLFILLLSGIVKLEWIEKAGEFMVAILPFLCVPSAINMIADIPAAKDAVIPILIVCIVSTAVVMAVTGLLSQTIRRIQKKYIPGKESSDNE